MARLTIAEKRERELGRLVQYKTATPTAEDFKQARRMMNSFYRLCGLCERESILSNTWPDANTRRVKAMGDRMMKWSARLDAEFQEVYGLQLDYCGHIPHIVKQGDRGGADAVQRFFYD